VFAKDTGFQTVGSEDIFAGPQNYLKQVMCRAVFRI